MSPTVNDDDGFGVRGPSLLRFAVHCCAAWLDRVAERTDGLHVRVAVPHDNGAPLVSAWSPSPLPGRRRCTARRDSTGGVGRNELPRPAPRSRGARDRRWARLGSRRVAPKPRATQGERELQGDAGRPQASSGTHQASSPQLQNASGDGASLTAERGLRGDATPRDVARPHRRPRDRTPQRTGACAATAGQPSNAESPNRVGRFSDGDDSDAVRGGRSLERRSSDLSFIFGALRA